MTYLISLLFSLGQIGRMSFFGQDVNIYLYEPFIGLVLLALLAKFRAEPLIETFKRFKSVFIFFGILLLSFLINISLYSPDQNIVAFLYFLRLSLYFVFFFYLNWYVLKSTRAVKLIQKGVLAFIVLTIFFTFGQYFFYPDLRNLYYLGWDPHLYRAFGTYLDTSVAAALYGLVLLFLILKYGKLGLSKQINLVLILIYSIMGLLTYSRGFYLAILITLFAYFVSMKKYLYVFLLILTFVFALFLLPKKAGEGVNLLRTFSIESRIEDNRTAISIWQGRPIFGIGYNRIRYEKEKIIMEKGSTANHSGASFPSSFLIILVTGGVIGLGALLYVLLKLFAISEMSKYLLLFTSVSSLWDNVLLHPLILFILFVFLALERRFFSYPVKSSH